MGKSCTCTQVEVPTQPISSRVHRTPQIEVSVLPVAHRHIFKPPERQKGSLAAILPVSLQKRIFEFLADPRAIADLFNFAYCFSPTGESIIFEFFDMLYIHQTLGERSIRQFGHYNRKLLEESEPLPFDMQVRDRQRRGLPIEEFGAEYIIRFQIEEIYLQRSFFGEIHRCVNAWIRKYRHLNFPISFVFRSDSRRYTEIFLSGFNRRRGKEYSPTITTTEDDARTAVYDPKFHNLVSTVVSTTSDIKFAEEFDRSHDWLYVCIPDVGIDLGHLGQREIALLYVPPEAIMLAYRKSNQQIIWNRNFYYFSNITVTYTHPPTLPKGGSAGSAAESAIPPETSHTSAVISTPKQMLTGQDIFREFRRIIPNSIVWPRE